MGIGRWQGRPEDSAAAAAESCAQLVEAVRSGDRGIFEAAVASWCDVVVADGRGWALWLWRGHSGFELVGRGGSPVPSPEGLAALERTLQTEAVRQQLAAGQPVPLSPETAGPDVSVAAVAFGSPACLLAVLATFEERAEAAIGDADLGVLASAARLCTVALESRAQTPAQAALRSGLLADLRDALTAIVGFTHTLIVSEHRLGRVDRRQYHAVIERQALALTGTIDAAEIVASPPVEAAYPHALTYADRNAFWAELATRLGPDANVTVSAEVAAALPAMADGHALAQSLAGLAVVVAVPGTCHVDVSAATSETVARVGVSAAIGDEAAAQVADLVYSVCAGAADAAWTSRAALSVAAAAAVARAHGGALGCQCSDGVARVWLDLPLSSAAP